MAGASGSGEPDKPATLDPRDQEYAASLPEAEREGMVSTIRRYQRTTSLQPGDTVPGLDLLRLGDRTVVRVPELVDGRPLVLVFGSFT